MKEELLPNKQVTLRFKKLSNKAEFRQKDHVMEGGKLNGAEDKIPLPLDEFGDVMEIFDEEERENLAKLIGRGHTADYYSVTNKEGYFWIKYAQRYRNISLSKEDRIFILNNPIDYIDYRILLKHPKLVANHTTDKNKYDTIKWYFIEGRAADNATAKMRLMAEILGMYEEVNRKPYVLKYILNSVSFSTSEDIPLERLQDNFLMKIEEMPETIKRHLSEDNLSIKATITEALEKGVLRKETGKITSTTLGKLCFEGQTPTMDNVAKFLKEPVNNEVLVKITALILQKNKAKSK